MMPLTGCSHAVALMQLSYSCTASGPPAEARLPARLARAHCARAVPAVQNDSSPVSVPCVPIWQKYLKFISRAALFLLIIAQLELIFAGNSLRMIEMDGRPDAATKLELEYCRLKVTSHAGGCSELVGNL